MRPAERWLAVWCGAVSAAYAAAIGLFAVRHADFYGDDTLSFALSVTVPFGKYVLTPFDVHPVPLHRLANYLMQRWRPVEFWHAVALLVTVHAATLVLLYRALQRLERAASNALLCAWYGTYVYIGALVDWWSAGLHRLPYIASFVLAVDAYVRFRTSRALADVVLVVLWCAVGTGFFEKAALVPAVLLLLEVALWSRTPRAEWLRHLWPAALLALLTPAYFFLWKSTVRPPFNQLYTDPIVLVRHVAAGWTMLFSSAVGQTYGEAWLGALFLALQVAVSTWLVRRNWVSWASGAVAVSLALLSTGLSAPRTASFALSIAEYAHGNYPDVLLILVLFSAVAWQNVARARIATPSTAWLRRRLGARAPWVWSGAAALSVGALALVSYTSFSELTRTFYGTHLLAHEYMANLRRGLGELEGRKEAFVFENGRTPPELNLANGPTGRLSGLLTALGIPAEFKRAGPGVYRVERDGTVRRTWREAGTLPPRSKPGAAHPR